MNPVSQIISCDNQVNSNNENNDMITTLQSLIAWNHSQTGNASITSWQQDLLVQMELS